MEFQRMSRIYDFMLPGKVIFAGAVGGALVLFGASEAMAISVVLPSGTSRSVPSTTAAAEPDLAGGVIHDTLVPFTIRTLGGQVVCTGNLQNRVVMSAKTGLLHFYYRIRDTRGPGAVVRIGTSDFREFTLGIAYRIDGLGTVPPRVATRSPAPGASVTFTLNDPAVSCARRQESRFIPIKTPVTTFRPGGVTRIIATNGTSASVPTVMP
jgi:hypothetical protein